MPGRADFRSRLPDTVAGYETVLDDLAALLESARLGTARVVNAVMTATYSPRT